jgi:hypothetical protein
MKCCGCAPLAVSTIYETVERLERDGRVCPKLCATAKSRLIQLGKRRIPSLGETSYLVAAE